MQTRQMLLDVIQEYHSSADRTAAESYAVLMSMRSRVPRSLFREMVLNYRTYHLPQHKWKIVRMYRKFIMTKTEHHRSDLAIGFNILRSVKVGKHDERAILDFMFARVKDVLLSMPHNNIQSAMKLQFIRDHAVMAYIEDAIVTRTPK